MTIGELSRLSGVSVRALRHYDKLGLLRPRAVSEAGYRQYDDQALERLHVILLFRELGVPLGEIRRMLDAPDFDAVAALDEQIARLEAKRQHLDNLILLAKGMKMRGLGHMQLSASDFEALDEVAARVGDTWQDTPAMEEYKRRSATQTDAEKARNGEAFEALIASFGEHPARPDDPAALDMVQRLRDFITEHFYECTLPILHGLANLYDGGGEFTQHIDRLAGDGAAAFLAEAVRAYCRKQEA